VLINHPRLQTVSGMQVREIKENRLSKIVMHSDANSGQSVGPAEMAVLGAFLIDGTSLVKLDLQGIDVGREGFFTLGFAIRTHTELTHLDLSRTRMYTENFRDLMPGLSVCTQLEILRLGTNFLEPVAMDSLAHLMDRTFHHLRVLDVRNNLIRADGVRVLGASIMHQRLTDIDMSNNHIGSRGCVAFIDSIKGAKVAESITNLNLSFNGMDVTAARALIACLSDMRNLKSLKLHSEIPVSELRSKRELSLPGMGFRDPEGVIVAHLLAWNVNLLTLDLRGNEFGPNSHRELSKVLVGLGSLRELNKAPFNSEMTAQDVLVKLSESMVVTNRLETPNHFDKSKHTDMTWRPVVDAALLNKQDIVQEDAAADASKVEDENEFQKTFLEWKEKGVRPQTAALSDGGGDSDPDAPARPPDFGFYKVGRNARLRQKAFQHKKPALLCKPTNTPRSAVKLTKERSDCSAGLESEGSDRDSLRAPLCPSTWSRQASAKIGTTIVDASTHSVQSRKLKISIELPESLTRDSVCSAVSQESSPQVLFCQ